GLAAAAPRLNLIHEQLAEINQQLKAGGASLLVRHGKPGEVWESIAGEFKIGEVFCNHDYEPYAIQRDSAVREFLSSQGIRFHTFKDEVSFETGEVVKADHKQYTAFTPYKNKWLEEFSQQKATLLLASEKPSHNSNKTQC